jgi:hypothetical protein
MAELWRALRALKALQAEAPDEMCEMREVHEMHEDAPALLAPPQDAPPIEPEARENPGEIEPAPSADRRAGTGRFPVGQGRPRWSTGALQ